MPRLTYQNIRDLDASEVSKMGKQEIVSLLKQVRKKYDTRKAVLERQGEKTYSPALEKMEAYYATTKRTAPSKISRNRAYNEIFQIQQFFNAKTSDIKGSKEVMREQDIRIFGSTKSGRPKKRMTVAQRTKFWSLYEDFIRTNKTAEYVFGYRNIWQELGDIVVSSTQLDNKTNVFSELEKKLRNETGNNIEYDDVFSGEWDSF